MVSVYYWYRTTIGYASLHKYSYKIHIRSICSRRRFTRVHSASNPILQHKTQIFRRRRLHAHSRAEWRKKTCRVVLLAVSPVFFFKKNGLRLHYTNGMCTRLALACQIHNIAGIRLDSRCSRCVVRICHPEGEQWLLCVYAFWLPRVLHFTN